LVTGQQQPNPGRAIVLKGGFRKQDGLNELPALFAAHIAFRYSGLQRLRRIVVREQH
jgi:hypothetical protein